MGGAQLDINPILGRAPLPREPMAQRTQRVAREPREPARLTAILASDNATVKVQTDQARWRVAAPGREPREEGCYRASSARSRGAALLGSGGAGPGLCLERERAR